MSDIFVDIDNEYYEKQPPSPDLTNTAALQIGSGSRVFRGDQSGIWLGAAKFIDAPFSVDMDGNLVATSADFSGTGYTKTVTFAQDAIPTSVAIGDLWVDTDDNNKLYRAESVGATTITAVGGGGWVVADQDAYKLDKVGGSYTTTISVTGRVEILPDVNTGIVAYAGDGTSEVFKVVVDGTDVGDVILGDYAGGNGVKWDQSASDFIIKGDMTAGSIDGVTITGGTITGTTFKTASTGTRVEISAVDDDIKIYDSGNDEVFRIDDEGGVVTIKAKDSRDLTLEATTAGKVIFLDNDVHIKSTMDLIFDGTQGSINCGSIDCDAIEMNNSDLTGVNKVEFEDTSQYIYDDGVNLELYFDGNTEFYHDGNLRAIIDDNIWSKGDLMADGTKPFLIDHPDGSDRMLRYTAQESPDVVLRYRGREKFGADGTVEVVPPEHFILVTEPKGEVTVNLTAMSPNNVWVKDIVKNEKFIFAGEPNTEVMYEIIAIRKGYLDREVEISKDSSENSVKIFNSYKKSVLDEKTNTIEKEVKSLESKK